MGRKVQLDHLSEEECEKILQVIQRDFNLRQKEKGRLGKIEEEISGEQKKSNILASEQSFNESCCMRCFSRFFFIFNSKVQCGTCKFFTCKKCSHWEDDNKEYICKVCEKQRELQIKSGEWFYNNVKKKFRRFGSAKVVRSLYKRKTDSDSENDSGYDNPPLLSNSMPAGKKSRGSVQGLFSASTVRDIPFDDSPSDRPLSNGDLVPPKSFHTPYTCPVALGQESFDSYQQKELRRFTSHLEGIMTELEQSSGAQQQSLADDPVMQSYRTHISSALSNLAQSLHLAIDNQSPADSPGSPTAKHQLVQQLIAKEVETFVGAPVDLGDENSSEYASEDGSTTSKGQLAYEDVLARAITSKMVERVQHKEEEKDLRKSLTKLSNQSTLHQLTDVLTDSDYTEDAVSSAHTSMRVDSDTDASESVSKEEGVRLSRVQEEPVLDTAGKLRLLRRNVEGWRAIQCQDGQYIDAAAQTKSKEYLMTNIAQLVDRNKLEHATPEERIQEWRNLADIVKKEINIPIQLDDRSISKYASRYGSPDELNDPQIFAEMFADSILRGVELQTDVDADIPDEQLNCDEQVKQIAANVEAFKRIHQGDPPHDLDVAAVLKCKRYVVSELDKIEPEASFASSPLHWQSVADSVQHSLGVPQERLSEYAPPSSRSEKAPQMTRNAVATAIVCQTIEMPASMAKAVQEEEVEDTPQRLREMVGVVQGWRAVKDTNGSQPLSDEDKAKCKEYISRNLVHISGADRLEHGTSEEREAAWRELTQQLETTLGVPVTMDDKAVSDFAMQEGEARDPKVLADMLADNIMKTVEQNETLQVNAREPQNPSQGVKRIVGNLEAYKQIEQLDRSSEPEKYDADTVLCCKQYVLKELDKLPQGGKMSASDGSVGNAQHWDTVAKVVETMLQIPPEELEKSAAASSTDDSKPQVSKDTIAMAILCKVAEVSPEDVPMEIVDDNFNRVDSKSLEQQSMPRLTLFQHEHGLRYGRETNTDDMPDQGEDVVDSELSELMSVPSPRPPPVVKEVDEVISQGSDSDNSRSSSPVRESPVKPTLVVREAIDPDDSFLGFEYAQSHRVPLPSFDDPGKDGLDLDDISRHGDDENTSTLESEVSFLSTWNFGGSPMLFNNISAYNNFGERKLGLDLEEPVYMLIPNSGDVQSPLVGEKGLDELSDLSENEEGSVGSSVVDSDEDIPMMDMSCQTDDLDSYSQPTSPITPVTVETTETAPPKNLLSEAIQDAKRKVLERKESLEGNLDQGKDTAEMGSNDSEIDPKFLIRPRTTGVPEGEPVRFTCEVEGTEPIDVFWYKEGVEVVQLEEDEHYDLSHKESEYSLEIYNTSTADIGQYMCIAINEQGQCNQSFNLKLEDNPNDKRAPEFLKNLTDAEVVEGSSVKFRCKLKGYPQPRLSWYKDGKRIKNSEQYSQEKIGNRDYILTIHYATLEDDAEYTVAAKNIMGEARTSAQLIVEPKGTKSEDELEDEPAHSARVSQASTTSSSLYPDTDDLVKLAERVSRTRDNVSSATNNMLDSANQLHSIHQHLDEMDRKLNNLEGEVHDAISPGADSVFTDDDNNRFSSPSGDFRESAIDEHQQMKSAAGNVRNVTNTALEVLTSASTAANSQKSLTDDDSSGYDSLRQASQKRKTILPNASEPSSDDEEVELNLSFNQFESLYSAGLVTREQLRKGRVSRKDKGKIDQFLDNNTGSRKPQLPLAIANDLVLSGDMPTSIDCGLKRIDSKRYKRDYVTNASSSDKPKKWKVRQPSFEGTEIINRRPSESSREGDQDDTEENIYMTAGKVFSLEERIKQLESQVSQVDEDTPPEQMASLENAVARTVAHVAQSEQQVTAVEVKLESVQRESSSYESPPTHRESRSEESREDEFSLESSPRSVELQGEAAEGSIPASQTEYDGDVPLPSVKALMSKFSVSHEDDDLEGGSLRRGKDVERGLGKVHSLTARDLPRTMRDKYKGHSPRIMHTTNVRMSLDNRTHSTDNDTTPSGDEGHIHEKGSSPVSVMATSSPRSSTPLVFESDDSSEATPVAGQGDELVPNKKGRKSTISERAAFWESRIDEAASQDKNDKKSSTQEQEVQDDESAEAV